MNLSFDNSITAKVVKAIAEFDLINDGDKIAVGLSGGKDSTFLLLILKLFNQHFKNDFILEAVHVDPGFDDSTALELKKITAALDLKIKIIKTNISDYIAAKEEDNPCSKCAHFRKGAIINYLKDNNFNKLAFGHHLDDAVETYLMSIFYSGQLKTLQAKRYLSKNKIEIIRPLIYLREDIIEEEIENKDITVLKSSCPYDGRTIRSETRKEFNKFFEDDLLFSNLVSAMREKNNRELWPAEMDKQILTKKMKNYWEKG
ncbi:tRNA 2-thiocytidine biosynthesis TtcA family protein [Halanaerobium congolense]|jgi:tRNA(Ile)-lysidine synthase TilS/MesJ|uniref:tRNA(Ile)-lysidine synthase TilS/MesJ n=1 Tax=Halanaerobium congolense TaxID=54121 RepID=A0A1G6HRC4_9FIRM|nr:tRNA 2-thiocytidine biosynthesis TtcA family protein [Halanaerobium congolense]SDB96415.1 tRNA(Ile)-lysidine synthase TilS/MesJ [Halanaerobium congolense]SDH32950.1 tRNA(Ile)-lysidine synthase TilS/MesJ [Halanaerobium congolense]SHM27539.1 tRNA(Ile)-lysidine synthase TilS/MesJ [Halanaerobium congolense]